METDKLIELQEFVDKYGWGGASTIKDVLWTLFLYDKRLHPSNRCQDLVFQVSQFEIAVFSTPTYIQTCNKTVFQVHPVDGAVATPSRIRQHPEPSAAASRSPPVNVGTACAVVVRHMFEASERKAG